MNQANWQAWVWIKWKPGTTSTAWEEWQKNPKIRAAWSTLGEWDCMLSLNIQTPEELETFVWQTVRKNQWVESTLTSWTKQWW